jgi:hypothetical protein
MTIMSHVKVFALSEPAVDKPQYAEDVYQYVGFGVDGVARMKG